MSMFHQHEIHHRATRYVLFVAENRDDVYLMAVTKGSGNAGQWIRLADKSVAWSYLVEKMPALQAGDAEGWAKAFKEAGIEVFGTEYA